MTARPEYEIKSEKPFRVLQWRDVIARPNFSGFVEDQLRKWLKAREIDPTPDLSYFIVFKRDLRGMGVRSYLLLENGPTMWYATALAPDPERALIESISELKETKK